VCHYYNFSRFFSIATDCKSALKLITFFQSPKPGCKYDEIADRHAVFGSRIFQITADNI
jgi:hypothetical protein